MSIYGFLQEAALAFSGQDVDQAQSEEWKEMVEDLKTFNRESFTDAANIHWMTGRYSITRSVAKRILESVR